MTPQRSAVSLLLSLVWTLVSIAAALAALGILAVILAAVW